MHVIWLHNWLLYNVPIPSMKPSSLPSNSWAWCVLCTGLIALTPQHPPLGNILLRGEAIFHTGCTQIKTVFFAIGSQLQPETRLLTFRTTSPPAILSPARPNASRKLLCRPSRRFLPCRDLADCQHQHQQHGGTLHRIGTFLFLMFQSYGILRNV